MTVRPDFEFVSAAACRDKRVGNCMEVAVNVPGIVALRESVNPDLVIETTPEKWTAFVEAVRGGEYDLNA
ncbi:DUF397 domain-containing protein [Streptomyces cavernicola]|uniref:DUF397 domain-containing protein n=1 Tax=Streptomyces cavernicola TaxID=3043613 RepID=A0ABT6SE48_9ACTN|nr:DUF397 domain-containing protein [Streptomyces sp. B-S-A6]MDI3405743.1 DUF397 domain-containing protein [Streptomyces sp. B-S-A6]